MERMGGGDKPLSEEQKAKIAEIDSKYSEIAERGKSSSKKAFRMP